VPGLGGPGRAVPQKQAHRGSNTESLLAQPGQQQGSLLVHVHTTILGHSNPDGWVHTQ